MREYILTNTLDEIFNKYSYAADFFTSFGIKSIDTKLTIIDFLDTLEDEIIESCGMERAQMIDNFAAFMKKMNTLKLKARFNLKEITVRGGYDKSGNKENTTLTMKPGEIICIVGP
ncbi:MAG: ABC transporter ATP-binding protein, partial [Bacillota bacterium]|nr:ABC transporter ATP-binding protein [Bacillota bacterium]